MTATEHVSDSERYPVKNGPFSSHLRLLRLVGQGNGRRLLDVGCAQGHLATEFAEADWKVTGIEPYQRDAEVARSKGLNVLDGDLSHAVANLEGSFDVVVAADVLEHMADPVEALEQIKALLSPSGRVVASIPNIAHLAVRAQLALGGFNYTERGPLDRTHLRFFTKRTVRELFDQAGYRVDFFGVTPAPLEVAGPMLRLPEIPYVAHAVNQAFANSWNGGLAYQFLLVARPEAD